MTLEVQLSRTDAKHRFPTTFRSFPCERDTIRSFAEEEIPNSYLAFSSSAMAAFLIPELFALSQAAWRRLALVIGMSGLRGLMRLSVAMA